LTLPATVEKHAEQERGEGAALELMHLGRQTESCSDHNGCNGCNTDSSAGLPGRVIIDFSIRNGRASSVVIGFANDRDLPQTRLDAPRRPLRGWQCGAGWSSSGRQIS
jgi:hypothetical protein